MGDFRAAEVVYSHGYEGALQRGDAIGAVKYLMSVGGCQLGDFRYREAMATFLNARALAIRSGDHADIAGLSLNISSVFTQMWDYSSALQEAENGLRAAAARPPDPSVPYLLLQIGRLHAMLADDDPVPYFVRGIEAARNAGAHLPIEASGWDWLGEQYLKAGKLDDAEHAFGEAYRLRTFFDRTNLGYSHSYLGALEFARGKGTEAERLTRIALVESEKGRPSWPRYMLLQQLGQVALLRGDMPAALVEFAKAAKAAARLRLGVVPAKATLTSSNIGVEQDVLRGFAQIAARHAYETGSEVWAAQALVAMEWNRAISLRESIALREAWRQRLPPAYWETLGQLQNVTLRHGGSGEKGEERRLRLEISEMEAQAGIIFSRNENENFLTRNSLIHFRGELGESDLFLSFLGECVVDKALALGHDKA